MIPKIIHHRWFGKGVMPQSQVRCIEGWSAYNMEIANELRLVGYKSATLGYGGSIRRGMNSMLLNRNYIVQE